MNPASINNSFVYLAAILDLYTRKVIGWAISKRIDGELCLAALHMALQQRSPVVGCIHHSDRGVKYARRDYVQLLRGRGLAVSMSAMAGLLFIASQPLRQMLESTATWLTLVHWLSR